MEKYNEYIKKFKVAIGILVIAIVVLALLISKIVPEVKNLTNIQKEYKEKSESLVDSERKLENLKNSSRKKEEAQQFVLKDFYKPITSGLDSETAISDEFAEVLQIIRENKIKTRSIKYEYDPQDDNFVKNASEKYHVCKITAAMIANYADFANFLRDLYKHEHFIEISKVEIAPYNKDKRILIINTQFKLYAQKKGGNTPPPVESKVPTSPMVPGNPELP